MCCSFGLKQIGRWNATGAWCQNCNQSSLNSVTSRLLLEICCITSEQNWDTLELCVQKRKSVCVDAWEQEQNVEAINIFTNQTVVPIGCCQRFDGLLSTLLFYVSCFPLDAVLEASQVAQVIKNPPANAGDARDMGSIAGLGRAPGGGNGNPLQYPCLENPMDRGVWQATVYGVAKSRTQLRDLAQVQDAVSDQMSITLPGRY